MAKDNYADSVLRLRNLRRIRQLKLMSQTTLAEKAGVTRNTISNLERDHAAQYETVRAIAGALEVSVEELVGDD